MRLSALGQGSFEHDLDGDGDDAGTRAICLSGSTTRGAPARVAGRRYKVLRVQLSGVMLAGCPSMSTSMTVRPRA